MSRYMVLLVAAALALGGATAGAQMSPVINEIYYDSPGIDQHTFVEILGAPGMHMDDIHLICIDGDDGLPYNTIILSGMVIPPDGYLVIAQDAGVPNADYIVSQINLENGPDELEMGRYLGGGQYQPLDAICYGASAFLNCEGGTNGPDVAAGNSISRCPNGWDTNDNGHDTSETVPTPGGPNDCPGGEPTWMSLCEAVQLDAAGFPLHAGEWVHISNPLLVLNDDGTFVNGSMQCGITDGECCAWLVDSDYDPGLMSGDEVDAIGVVGFFEGRVQIGGPAVYINTISTGNELPDATLITTEELATNGAQYEGCLIQLSSLRIVGGDPWPTEGQDARIIVTDPTGVEAMLHIDSDTNIDGTPAPVQPFSICGLGGQADPTEPYDSGYEILPRSVEDVNCGDASPARTESWGAIKREFK